MIIYFYNVRITCDFKKYSCEPHKLEVENAIEPAKRTQIFEKIWRYQILINRFFSLAVWYYYIAAAPCWHLIFVTFKI